MSTDQPTAVLVSRLADFLADRPADPAVKITETLQPDWEEAYQPQSAELGRPAIVRMILDGNPPRAFAAVAADEPDDRSELVAIARGHRSGGLAGTGGDLDPS